MVEADKYYVKICYDCGCETMVIDSNARKNGLIARRRRCKACGYTFTTFEVEESLLDNKSLIGIVEEQKARIADLESRLSEIKNLANV